MIVFALIFKQMEINGNTLKERIMSLKKYEVSLDQITIGYDLDFAINIPFGNNLHLAFKFYNVQCYVFIPTDTIHKTLLQAIINIDSQCADLDFIHNYKDGKFIPTNGGGNVVLNIWDWFAELVGIMSTCLCDMSRISFKSASSENERTVSLRLLSMILHPQSLSWYERHDYHLSDQDQNFAQRTIFFSDMIQSMLPIVKQEIDYSYEYLCETGTCPELLPNLICLYIKMYYNDQMCVKMFLQSMWTKYPDIYYTFERVLFMTHNKDIRKYMRTIHNEEDLFTKMHKLAQ